MTQNKIMVAIDGSEYSYKVIDKAIEYARLLNGEVLLVYCHRKFPRILGQPHKDQIISAIMDETKEVVEPFVKRLKEAKIEFIKRFMEEPASEMISKVAAHEECNLIIMGCRGLTDLEGLLIGSITHRVLQTAPCSVLVVRGDN